MSDDPETGGGFSNGAGLVSRRRVLAAGSMVLGGVGMGSTATSALFHDAESATGEISVDDDPTLNYNVVDNSAFSASFRTGARYQIQYQAAWVRSFDRVEIQVENVDDGSVPGDSVTETAAEGAVTYPRSGTYDDGSQGDTYRFTIEVYSSGDSSPVLSTVVTDDAGGGGTGDGDMGSVDDPTLADYQVTDDSGSIVARYAVDYQLENATANNFSEVAVTFDDLDVSGNPGQTNTSTSRPNGTVSYTQVFTADDNYRLTIEVKNENGIVVDSATVSDVADGTDP